MKNRIFLFVTILGFSLSYAQKMDSVSPMDKTIEQVLVKSEGIASVDSLLEGVYNTTNKIYERKFAPNYPSKYQSDDFNYDISKPKMSAFQKFLNKLEEIFAQFFQTSYDSGLNELFLTFIRIVAIVAVGVLLYFIIRYFMMKNGTWIFSRSAKKRSPESRTITENIHELDLPYLIGKYEQEENYRYAIRYNFLLLLKHLTDHKIIRWDPEKTNGEYLAMMRGKPLYDDFKRLFYIFDHIWYGERKISKDEYFKFKKNFEAAMLK